MLSFLVGHVARATVVALVSQIGLDVLGLGRQTTALLFAFALVLLLFACTLASASALGGSEALGMREAVSRATFTLVSV